MRLVPGWDLKLIDMERRASELAKNPRVVLSTYAGLLETYDMYLAGDPAALGTSPRMCQAFFNENDMISFHGASILQNTTDPLQVPFVAGGLLFCKASPFFNLVPMDPHLDDLFVGEEILLSARLWTSGFDIFCPNENIAFHKFTRDGEPKFWENERDDRDATLRVRYILKLLRPQDKMTKKALHRVERYGLGTERPLEEYWRFAGVDVANHRILKNFCGPVSEGETLRWWLRRKWWLLVLFVVLSLCAALLSYA